MGQYDSYQDSAAFHGFEEPPKRRGGAFFKIIVTLLVLILLSLVGLLLKERYEMEKSALNAPAATSTPLPTADESGIGETPRPTATPVTEANRPAPSMDGIAPELPMDDENNPIPDIFEAVSPSVVGIVNYVEMPVGNKRMLTRYGTGTGFIVSSEGYVLTNAHVIANAVVVTVKLSDGKEIDAEIIGSDPETDVAVLRIGATDLKPLKCGDSDQVRVGEYALAIGNPLDADRLNNTLTFGIISATSREITIDSYTNSFLQTDAAINYGNSGGPLLNMKGEVIGINSAKSVTAGYDSYGNPVYAEGIGFALPINHVLEIMDTLVREGVIRRPGVGITVSTVSEVIAENEGIPVGAYVQSVVSGGPAQRGGLQAGDVIVEAEGTAIKAQADLVELIENSQIGDTIDMKVYREGEYLTVSVTVGNKTDMNFEKSE